jgi:hypothetical protein
LSDSAILPVSVGLENGRAVITRLDFGDAGFAEPFFRHTIAFARGAVPVVTPYEDFRAEVGRSREPAGFIFHMSRCGSTLVSQMLKEIAGVRVYGEPPPVNETLVLLPQLPRREVRDLLGAVIRAFCARSERAFFKFSSWNVLEYSLFDELFPAVPKLFVVRRPVEVLASIAGRLPGFAVNPGMYAELIRRRAGDRADTLGEVERAAVVLGLMLDAMAAARSGSTCLLDYADLPAAAWRMLPRFFGIAEERIDVARMEDVAGLHSKFYPARVPFEREDRSAPRADAALLEDYAAAWIGSRYDDLIASYRTDIHQGG